jgi:ribosomal protein S26
MVAVGPTECCVTDDLPAASPLVGPPVPVARVRSRARLAGPPRARGAPRAAKAIFGGTPCRGWLPARSARRSRGADSGVRYATQEYSDLAVLLNGWMRSMHVRPYSILREGEPEAHLVAGGLAAAVTWALFEELHLRPRIGTCIECAVTWRVHRVRGEEHRAAGATPERPHAASRRVRCLRARKARAERQGRKLRGGSTR